MMKEEKLSKCCKRATRTTRDLSIQYWPQRRRSILFSTTVFVQIDKVKFSSTDCVVLDRSHKNLGLSAGRIWCFKYSQIYFGTKNSMVPIIFYLGLSIWSKEIQKKNYRWRLILYSKLQPHTSPCVLNSLWSIADPTEKHKMFRIDLTA